MAAVAVSAHQAEATTRSPRVRLDATTMWYMIFYMNAYSLLLLPPLHAASHFETYPRFFLTGGAGRPTTPRHQRNDADREGRIGRHDPGALPLVRKLHICIELKLERVVEFGALNGEHGELFPATLGNEEPCGLE